VLAALILKSAAQKVNGGVSNTFVFYLSNALCFIPSICVLFLPFIQVKKQRHKNKKLIFIIFWLKVETVQQPIVRGLLEN